MAIAVALGTTFCFITLPPIIALRALSHVVFCRDRGILFTKNPSILLKNGKPTLFNARFQAFNLVIGLIHSIVEMLVVAVFYFTGNVPRHRV